MIYSIGSLASEAGCKVVTIRFYERSGLLPKADRSAAGYRVFNGEHLRRLRFIRRSRDLGFSLGEIRELLSLADQRNRSCDCVDDIVAEHLGDVRQRIGALRALERKLVRMKSACKGGRIEDCRVVHALSGLA
jgi:DNA-binding transcriptional MerR regulator